MGLVSFPCHLDKFSYLQPWFPPEINADDTFDLQQATQQKNISYASARFTRLVVIPLLHFVLSTFFRSSVNWGCGDSLLMVFRPPRLSGGA